MWSLVLPLLSHLLLSQLLLIMDCLSSLFLSYFFCPTCCPARFRGGAAEMLRDAVVASCRFSHNTPVGQDGALAVAAAVAWLAGPAGGTAGLTAGCTAGTTDGSKTDSMDGSTADNTLSGSTAGGAIGSADDVTPEALLDHLMQARWRVLTGALCDLPWSVLMGSVRDLCWCMLTSALCD